jgi:hypothetical protein
MHSLNELKQFLESKAIKIKFYNGWKLIVGKDTWGMAHDILYCNSEPVHKKEVLVRAQQSFEEDKKYVKHQSTQTRNWRGIGGRNRDRDGDDY